MPDSSSTRQLPSLLLIDDDVISREVLQMTLEMHGFAVETAEDGATGLARLADMDVQPGVILMDTQMPGLSGIELIAELRGRSKARIVAISGSDPGEAIRQAADGFLMKPIQPEALLAWGNWLDGTDGIDQPEPGKIAQVQAEQQSAASLVDPVVLGKLRAMMPASAVLEIYMAVAADLKTRLATLQEAMDSRNGAEVARIAHAIKGGCAMVGLTNAREAASRLEISNAPVTWPAELSQLRIALSGLEGMLGDEFPA
jgi:CheY-like chemotaxis protein